MSRSKKLKPVVDLKHQATEKELKTLGELTAIYQQEQSQLNDLAQYRKDYLIRFQTQSHQLTAQKSLELRRFLTQLDQAIDAQEMLVEKCQQEVKKQQQQWLQARTKEQAVELLVEKYQAQEAHQLLKKEQREGDEYASRMWVRKNRK